MQQGNFYQQGAGVKSSLYDNALHMQIHFIAACDLCLSSTVVLYVFLEPPSVAIKDQKETSANVAQPLNSDDWDRAPWNTNRAEHINSSKVVAKSTHFMLHCSLYGKKKTLVLQYTKHPNNICDKILSP